jgi:hypothetical protein
MCILGIYLSGPFTQPLSIVPAKEFPKPVAEIAQSESATSLQSGTAETVNAGYGSSTNLILIQAIEDDPISAEIGAE